MVKVRIRASQESFDSRGEDRGEFVTPKPGYYILSCTECEPGFTKDKDGEEIKAQPYLKFTYKITGVGVEEADVAENYGNVWDYMSFSESSDWKRAEVLAAYSIATGAFDGEVDTDDFVNRKVLAALKNVKGQTKDDPKQAKIRRLLPYGSVPDAADSEVDYGEETPPEPTDAVFDTPAETKRYFQAELDGKELKELGAILKDEFLLNPADCIVKGADGKTDMLATKGTVIGAILAAQGMDAPAAAEENDPFADDPF